MIKLSRKYLLPLVLIVMLCPVSMGLSNAQYYVIKKKKVVPETSIQDERFSERRLSNEKKCTKKDQDLMIKIETKLYIMEQFFSKLEARMKKNPGSLEPMPQSRKMERANKFVMEQQENGNFKRIYSNCVHLIKPIKKMLRDER